MKSRSGINRARSNKVSVSSGINLKLVTGTREEQARQYEAIDKKYDRPAYMKTGYVTAKISEVDGDISIDFEGERISGIGRLRRLPSGKKASKSEREGLIKYLMYDARPEMELRIHDFNQGFPTMELSQKYRGKSVSKLIQKEIYAEADRQAQRILGSSISEAGKKLIESNWLSEGVRMR